CTICSRKALRSGGAAFPWNRFHVRTRSGTRVAYGCMRVLLADPSAFTPSYDHELAAALARAGADVELVTSRFRFGAAPPVDGYRRSEVFYPLSSRLFGRSRLRLPLKVLEHPLGLVALRRRPGRARRALPRGGGRDRERVAARLPGARRGRPCLRRGDGGRFPVPARARPERRAAARARRGRAGGGVRRRRDRRAGPPLRRGPRGARGRRRGARRG